MKLIKIIKIFFIVLFLLLVFISMLFLIFPSSWDLETCNHECIREGYEFGYCLWPDEAMQLNYTENLGTCLIENSRHCKYKDQCNCYCK